MHRRCSRRVARQGRDRGGLAPVERCAPGADRDTAVAGRCHREFAHDAEHAAGPQRGRVIRGADAGSTRHTGESSCVSLCESGHVQIVLLPSAYAPAVGGVEELTARLVRRRLAAGDEVEVWTIRQPPDLPVYEEIDGVRVRRFELPRLSARTLARFPREALRPRRRSRSRPLSYCPSSSTSSASARTGSTLAPSPRRRGVDDSVR